MAPTSFLFRATTSTTPFLSFSLLVHFATNLCLCAACVQRYPCRFPHIQLESRQDYQFPAVHPETNARLWLHALPLLDLRWNIVPCAYGRVDPSRRLTSRRKIPIVTTCDLLSAQYTPPRVPARVSDIHIILVVAHHERGQAPPSQDAASPVVIHGDFSFGSRRSSVPVLLFQREHRSRLWCW